MTLVSPLRPWPGVLEPLWWAARAFSHETLGFRFDYPIEVVPEAGTRGSLRYYVYSERMFFDAMKLDACGIPHQRSRTHGETYNPAYVAWYGLMNLELFLRTRAPEGREAFLTQLEWLRRHAVWREDGSVIWPFTFDLQEGRCALKAPWISAMVQGLVMSILVRGYRVTGDLDLLRLSLLAIGPFQKSIEDGGVRTLEQGYVLYEEYPGYPLPRILDGFLFSLLGLYDLSVQTGEPRVIQLFVDGIDGLKHTLPFWDYRGKWSWYGSHGYLCPPRYNRLNSALLAALGRLSSDRTIERYAKAWNPGRLTVLGRAEIFLVFLFTKNRSRLRHMRSRR